MFERGTIIQNRYEIIEEVGSGGMSVVYKAKCHVLNRYVAIKVLNPEFSDDKSFVSKFRIEAQSAAGLSHPNIVNVYDVGEENGFYYIVMELVEGITLKEYIQQNGRLPYQTALDFIMQIAAGIEAAHEHHTIHRDIKPQNIIVSKNGTLKVTDFGIAKAATSNTVASSAMGSVHYISPEQARGGYSDERSDIYSLGITLYELLTGRVPFEGENNVTVALMHIQSEIIPPREYYPDIPVGLEKIVLKATQKKPERRYLTTNAFLADLRKLTMDPNADVGNASVVMTNDAPTIQISEGEIAAINNAASVKPGISMFPVTKNNSELEEANRELERLYNDIEDDEEEEEESIFDSEDDEEEPDNDLDPKMEKLITIGAISVTVIIAVIIIAGIASMFGVFRHDETPDTEEEPQVEIEVKKMIKVVGLTRQDAITALDDAEIAYEIEREYSDTVAEDTVMEQSIAEGTELQDGDRVKIVISKGQEKVDVPDVLGKTLEEARADLEAAGFVVDEDDEYDAQVAENHVISQTPSGGASAEKGSTVTIVVSKGEEIKVAVVPDLKKKTVTEADQALSSVNLNLGNVTQDYSDSVKEGQVISQSIASGTEVKEGTSVDIVISKGKEPTTAVNITYEATFTGAISNNSYVFTEGELVRVTLTLKVGAASYTVLDDFYDEAALPIQLSNVSSISGLSSSDGTLVYSVKDTDGNDITGNFSSSVQAKIKAVEQ